MHRNRAKNNRKLQFNALVIVEVHMRIKVVQG